MAGYELYVLKGEAGNSPSNLLTITSPHATPCDNKSIAMYQRTNTLQKYIDAFSDAGIIKAISKAESNQSEARIIGITNPIMRFLINTSYASGGKIYSHSRMGVPPEDYSVFNMVSAILSDIAPELEANPSYKNQLLGKLLHTQSGPMLSALNEVLVAAYYKHLGIKVCLNSSMQEGAADIDLTELPFASDVKLFPNKRLLLEAIVNDSAKEIMKAVKLVQNQGLLISVFVPDKKLIKKSLIQVATTFQDTSVGHYADEVLCADIMDNDYPGADFHLAVQPQNVNVFFQASWDMAYAIDELRSSVEKAVKQARVLAKQAIPWVMVPRDAGRNGIELAVLRFEGKFHDYVSKHTDIFAMPVYSIEFEGNRVLVVFDIFQTGENTFRINADTFQAFIKSLISRPEAYV